MNIKILKERADEISARMKILGKTKIADYITLLINHDLWMQAFRKRLGIVPFSEHKTSWSELYQLIKKKLTRDIKRCWKNIHKK